VRQYDFTALSKTANPKPLSVAGQTGTTEAKQGSYKWIIWLIVLAFIGVGIYSAVAATQASKIVSDDEILGAVGFGFLNVLMTFGFIAAIAAAALYGMRLNKQRLARINQFAQANGLVFRQNLDPFGMKGMIFDDGHSRKVKESLAFPDGVEIGNYTFVTGSGKNRQTHNFGYIRVALNKALPNMVLDARHNNFLGMTNLPDVFHSSQRLRLEGDFNEYFDLYAPQEYERDALYVFTPDVMQVLIQSGRKYDMEIVDNELFIYQPTFIDLSSEVRLREALTAMTAISTELRDQTKRYSDERVVGAPGAQVVAEPGRRLKKGVNWLVVMIVVGIIGMNLILTFAPKEISTSLSVAYGFIFWAVVIVALISRRYRR
jgi:hypothetical protein